MEDGDSDAEMADYYGTDFPDDVDPNFDAKARPRPHCPGHWQVPTSATSDLAQSREADGSCMFPLSDPASE